MKVRKLAAPVGIAAITIGIAASTVVPASAANNIKPFGQQETINDYGTGAPMIGYTVSGLNPSSDPVPHNGQLYAANVTVNALGGWATPIVALFNARAESGANYRVIANAPGGPAAAPPGGSSTGTLYFDVVGDVPNSVVYNDGTQDPSGVGARRRRPSRLPSSTTGAAKPGAVLPDPVTSHCLV